jgi:hypothetical protein
MQSAALAVMASIEASIIAPPGESTVGESTVAGASISWFVEWL